MANLPLELLGLICDELGHQEDFETLFACALTGWVLSRTAVQKLYCNIHFYTHFHHFIHFVEKDAHLRRLIAKEVILWKSIILSTASKTAFPYYLFIRSLDFCYLKSPMSLGDLKILVDHSDFQSKKAKSFSSDHSRNLTDHDEYIELIGDTLISHMNEAGKKLGMEPKIERLTWHNKNGALTRWTRQLPKLKALEISESIRSGADHLAMSISIHCPKFRELILASINPEGLGKSLSSLFRGLNQNTVRISQTYDLCQLNEDPILRLQCHADSVKIIKLSYLFDPENK
ncbi:hypothetical protein K3495_g14727 [Podosphaera aphanis]|nr:hypothetical protein K3495_g14727 [Podosphaera aphanis]